MQIGRKLYYEIKTGNIILNTGERQGSVIETTREQDFETYKALKDRIPETVGLIELEYGEYAEDFAACNGYRINIETTEIEFSYPDPNAEPEQPQVPVYQTPLSVRVENVESENAGMALELAMTQSRLDLAEQEQANLLLSLVEGGIL